jgi:hypothetical protein
MPRQRLASHNLCACRYGIYILVVECMGISAMLPYAALLVVYTLSSGSKGLPKDDGQTIATKRCVLAVLASVLLGLIHPA